MPFSMHARKYLLYPSLLFLLIISLIELSSLDLRFSEVLYELQGGAWTYKESWLLEDLLHSGGRTLSSLVGLALLLSIVASFFVAPLRERRRGLVYLFLAALTGSLIVSVLKQLTHVDCPWDFTQFGGDLDYLGLYESKFSRVEYGQCFPAGHASAAYCWFGLVYLAIRYRPRLKIPAFAAVVLLGLLFGLTQQIRGAHFLSHDIWTAWICWVSAYLWSVVLLRNSRRKS